MKIGMLVDCSLSWNVCAFQRQLCQVSLMGPLRAGRFELGSYQRGYNYIVK